MGTSGAVFIATSVDGYIARADDGLDWLEDPAGGGEDYGYATFVASVDAILLGRRSYERVLTFDAWPYGGRRVIVASRRATPRRDAPPGNVELAAEAPLELFARLGREGVRRVYVDGGRLITACLEAGLIDEVTITRIPILLGDGVPLFGPLSRDVRLEHLRTRAWPNGFVRTTYRVAAPARAGAA